MTSVQASSAAPGQTRHFFRWALGVFALGLIARTIHLWQIRAAPMFGLKIGDSLIYDEWARQIVSGDVSTEVYWYAPLYPYFLAGIYKLFGDATMWPLAVQAVIGSLSCVILADTGRRLISPSTGIVAGAILAVYAPAIFYDGILHKPVLVLFFLCLTLWLWAARLRDPGTLGSWLWLGVALGLLVLARQNILAFFPVMLLWILTERRVSLRRRVALSTVFTVGLALPLIPVAARNKIVGGEFHLTAANFGDNFYKGNNEQADGTYMALPGGRPDPRFERHDATEIAQRAMGRKLSPAEISSYWTRRSLEYIAARPGHWIGLMVTKTFLTWNAVEIGDVEDPYTYSEWSAPVRLTMPILHFGVIAPLAVLGLFVTWKRWRVLWPVHLMIAIYAATVVMFYVFGRYRYPLVPFMILFAAAGLTGGIRYIRTSSRRQLVACCGAALAMLVLSNWPTGLKGSVLLTTQRNLAATLHDQGRFEEAVGFYARALEITPHNVPLRVGLADAMVELAEIEDAASRQALIEEAIRHYRHALVLVDDEELSTRIRQRLALYELGR